MKKEAIQHFNTEEYIYPVKRNELVFKIRCAKKDISKCILVYWDRTKPENQKKQELKCCYRDGLFDYFQGKIIFHQIARYQKYYFELTDSSGNMMYYTANGLQQAIPKSGSFEYLYVNGTDVITFPEWAKGVIYYQIFPERFCNGNRGNDPEGCKPWGTLPDREHHMGGDLQGIIQKIPYLKDLGITAVELMPIFEFDEMEDTRVVDGERLYNYWGYNTVCFFAPNTSYTSVVEHNHEGDELKNLIYELKENGIEVILDVVFNHTAEGNEKGPCFSFKGIDNNIYYMLTPDGYYYNFSGCGNVMNCNHPIVRKFIIDCLRYWVINYRVDGFRFDLASILSRDQNGAPMENPPILQGLACDPILAKAKLIAEAWDAGGLYQVGSFPSWNRWAEWNGRYRDDMRRFLKGDGGMAGTAITRITGSRDLYDPAHRGISASVNFLTCHDGFTLYDLYSYNMKHNEKNGWGNTDGDNNGNSWNCGTEGATDDPEIEGLRRRMVKNAFATLMCSRGPAMFFAGDEFCNTQFGNNNSYCQDNITSWLDWNRLEEYKEIHDFFRYMIRLRKDNAILRKTTKPAACKLPEISIHNGFPWNGGTDNNSRLIGIMYAGRDENDIRDDIVFYCMNAYWETLIMQLPELPMGMQWKVCVNTFLPYEDGKNVEEQTEFYYKKSLKVPPRTVIILTAEES